MALRFVLLDMAILTLQLEIKQWGRTEGITTIPFNITFPNAPLVGTWTLITNASGTLAISAVAISPDNLTNSSFSVRNTTAHYWLWVGY